jgi:hypothetical protein
MIYISLNCSIVKLTFRVHISPKQHNYHEKGNLNSKVIYLLKIKITYQHNRQMKKNVNNASTGFNFSSNSD